MLHTNTLTHLSNSKNLLAFSGGADSTALFFLLQEYNIPFDIAIVDYSVREQSKEEVAYAQLLAKRYTKECFVYVAQPIEQNFEAKAREIRYTFFEKLIVQHHYENLLTAHHLGDRLEWFLMQLSKGAGCVELVGMQEIQKQNSYTLVRPLLHLPKQRLLAYLQQHNHRYFEDVTNQDMSYKRNYFRHTFAQPLLEEFAEGIAKSFDYIDRDITLCVAQSEIQTCNELSYFVSRDARSDLVTLDRYLKQRHAHLMRGSEKEAFLAREAVVVGRKYIVARCKGYVCIAPYIVAKDIPKKLKERLRVLKVAPKLRGYLATDAEAVELLSLLLA